MKTHSSLPAGANASLSRALAWSNVVLAALLMLATLPGRTQGLGLITEPLLKDLKLEAMTYAQINLWATLLGAAFSIPAGWMIDRWGLRLSSVLITLLLSAVVWQMSAMAGGVMLLFVLILLTRALGQSALSVVSITTVGKSFQKNAGWAMGVYSVLLSVFFATAFVLVGGVITDHGWRTAWTQVAVGLVVVSLLSVLIREPGSMRTKTEDEETGVTLSTALRTPLFWVFAGATALFGLVSSGFGLFNEAVLAEQGFNAETFHRFLAVTTLFALIGQMICGWLSLTRPLPRLLAVAMVLYGAGLAALPMLRTQTHLWIFAAIFGVAAGFITVIFFAVWGLAFGQRQLGRIQGAAQMLTVFASAIGPLLFARSHEASGSYAPLLCTLAPIVLASAAAAWFTKLKRPQRPVPQR